ncbi:MAG TPA: zf-HC2 domain-containing protein [Gaiellaceae bacterium]
MPRWRRTTACERAAQWISLELDGEIAGLERAALARHLERCDRCRYSRSEIGGFTRELRDSMLEGPVWPIVITVPQTRRRAARVGLAALVTGFAVLAGLSLYPSSNKPAAGALGFVNAQEQRAFGQEHVSMEPTLFVVEVPSPGSLGARALR